LAFYITDFFWGGGTEIAGLALTVDIDKGMEPAAGAFTDIRDSWALQDGIKDLSSLYPVTVTNC